MRADTTLARVMARAGRSGKAGRSEAYAWLRLRFEQLASRLQHRPGWPAVAAGMATGGIKGGRGKPLTGPALRRIWSRVCRDVAAEEPWHEEAIRTAPQHGATAGKPCRREPVRGAKANRPPPIVTASELSAAFHVSPRTEPSLSPLMVPVPSCPPPLASRDAMNSRPNAASSDGDRAAERKAKTPLLRRLAGARNGHDPEEIT